MCVIQDFDTVLNISFSLMLGVYGAVAALGYYYFGSSAHTLLTTDLARNSPFSGHYFLLPGLTADKMVALSIMLNAYSTYPSLVLVMQVSPTALARRVHCRMSKYASCLTMASWKTAHAGFSL